MAERRDVTARATFTRGAAIEPGALLEALLAAAPAGLGFLDADLRFIRLNAALASMHGVDRHEAVGQPYSAVWREMPSDLAERSARPARALSRPSRT